MEFKNIKIKILCEKYGLITLTRERFYNAIDDHTTNELIEALNLFKEKKRVKVLIITGIGEKAFSSGGDLKRIRSKTCFDILQTNLQDLCYQIENYYTPVIAAINGVAMGGGLELAMACDFRIAVSSTCFALPETSLGLIPSAGGTQRLIRLIGEAKAKEVIMLGKRLTSNEAIEYGLISKIVNKEDLITECIRISDTLSQKSPMALYLSKMAINIGNKDNTYSGMQYEKMCQAVLMEYGDKQEGIEAFFSKRMPNFKEI
ncbi:enoyl-CoA hydratase/isomerase family protein [Mediterraneibacter agrestimuris]|uniref:enoyl-CoA hydratase/isomerase family protein n=1 Tax=Mediterraneibacter agrestimuris TaxID=2941333 RepID=UPI00203EE7AB|nr:enoyl-CoA hydratase-related protein [Mediterraneibacter agrestimuris]